jgi:putative transposase
VSKNIDSELCKRALANALALRGRHMGLVFHSDRGSQYSSRAYKSMPAENGIESSMNEPGCPYDNSCEELFFALLKSVFSLRSKKK